ncbi:MAG: universal stress protein [Thermodesulfobacteriota bacterium]|nr:universal stress protein [Thermodesulfobacteriota bacterium]
MSISILFAVNDSASSRAAVNYLEGLPFCPDDVRISIVHVFRQPSSGEELMGKKFMAEQADRYQAVMDEAKNRLVEGGFPPDNIETELVSEPYQTISDGIMDLFAKEKYDMVVIGRKRMSKAEEFVLGDPSIKLVRALEGTAIVVIKS